MPTDLDYRRCTIDGCERKHCGHGYCTLHWKRWRRHGDPHTILVNHQQPRTCNAPGCDDIHQARGYCQRHYQRLKYQERARKRRRIADQGVQGNTVCTHPSCETAPMGGGHFCLDHFWTEIVLPRRAELEQT